MRRADRAIADPAEIRAIIDAADSVRVALKDEPFPYVVALNFGYEEGVFWFHSAKQGRKLELLRADGRVAFQLDADHRLETGDKACDWGMKYSSVAGTGMLSIVEDPLLARKGLDLIMEKYGAQGPQDYDDKVLAATAVLRLDVTSMTGKAKK